MNRENFGIFKAVIIGAGASGLALAINLSKKYGGENIALIETLDRVGKKLLSTGNGQCNLTNYDCDLSHFHSNNNAFFAEIINNYGKNAVVSFYESLGIPICFDGDRAYPLSKQASSVLDALRFKLASLNTKVFLGKKVIGLNRENGVYNIEPVLLCFVYCFTSSKAGDTILKGYKTALKFEVVTSHPNEISAEIIQKLKHTATVVHAEGMFSHQSKELLICVVNKNQIVEFERIVKKYPETFAYLSTVSETMGNFVDASKKKKEAKKEGN